MVGLGNPGANYVATRHNVGFVFVEALAELLKRPFQRHRRVQGLLCEVPRPAAGTLRLLKPGTFMNLSGREVQAASAYWRIPPSRLLVVHDDLDLSPGTVRLKCGGGSGGHRGVEDIIRCLGQGDFSRLRLGIGHPPAGSAVDAYVLAKPSPSQAAAQQAALERGLAFMPRILAGELSYAMNHLNARNGDAGETA